MVVRRGEGLSFPPLQKGFRGTRPSNPYRIKGAMIRGWCLPPNLELYDRNPGETTIDFSGCGFVC